MSEAEDLKSIFTTPRYEVPEPTQSKKFMPWHKLRKQYVREKQWSKSLLDLLIEHPIEGRPIKYLGLPGNELFDLRVLHKEVCVPKELSLHFLGFNTGAKVPGSDQMEIDLSTEEVKRLEMVDGQSKVMPDDFRSLADHRSMAWSEAQRVGPFDVVNIDLCDGFGKEFPGKIDDTYYNAMREILTIQSSTNRPWLLFLTTRVGQEYAHGSTFDRLRKVFEQNISTCAEFRDATSGRMRISSIADIRSAARSPRGYSNIFITGLSKWLVAFGRVSAPKAVVRLCDLMGYSVKRGAVVCDLVSAVFKVSPVMQPPRDRFNLASSRLVPIPSECEIAVEIVDVVCNCEDVDASLRDDSEERRELLSRSSALMHAARYDGSEYQRWALLNL